MTVPQAVQDALVSLEVTFLGVATLVVGALGTLAVQWLRQKTQSLAIATGMQIAGDAAYRKMVSAARAGASYETAEKLGLDAGQRALTDVGPPVVNAMGEQATGAVVHAGLGAALKVDPTVALHAPAPPPTSLGVRQSDPDKPEMV